MSSYANVALQFLLYVNVTLLVHLSILDTLCFDTSEAFIALNTSSISFVGDLVSMLRKCGHLNKLCILSILPKGPWGAVAN